MISKDELIKLYFKEGLSTTEIAQLKGIGRTTVFTYLRKYNLKPRSMSEAIKLFLQKNPRPKGNNSPHWKGGKHKSKRGYVYVYDSRKAGFPAGQRYSLEHRCVWERAYGPIPDTHIIHHINGIKQDNRLENLVMIPRKRHETFTLMRIYQKRIHELEKRLASRVNNGW